MREYLIEIYEELAIRKIVIIAMLFNFTIMIVSIFILY